VLRHRDKPAVGADDEQQPVSNGATKGASPAYRRDGVDTRSCGGGVVAVGRTVVRRADAGAGSTIGNLIWFLIAHRIGCSGTSIRAGASGVLASSASALPWAASAQMTKMSSVMTASAQNG
jgi:hypothetical protein